MMKRLTLGASIVLLLSSTSPTRSLNLATDVAAQAPPSQSPEGRGQSPSNMQDMMKMHQQMMAEMKAGEAKLDALVKDMNAASGETKVTATAAVVNELVQQHKAMHGRMGQTHQQMMGGRGRMMGR